MVYNRDSAVTTISQSLLYTSTESGKLLALQNLLSSGQLPYPSLIFTQSIERADQLHKALLLDAGIGGQGLGLRVGVVHGDLSEGKRAGVLDGFRKGEIWVLVVTEVMARGMDFKGVKVVVNYGQSTSPSTSSSSSSNAFSLPYLLHDLP
jgi:ATP-dependent RNA helicase DDX52/ROK1